jgi:hypothetical protein
MAAELPHFVYQEEQEQQEIRPEQAEAAEGLAIKIPLDPVEQAHLV